MPLEVPAYFRNFVRHKIYKATPATKLVISSNLHAEKRKEIYQRISRNPPLFAKYRDSRIDIYPGTISIEELNVLS